MNLSRRRLLAQACCGSIFAAAVPGSSGSGEPGKTRLILLGTAGGPSPKKSRAAPSQVILSRDSAFVVDCGNGVARQLILAGVPLPRIRHIFLTHHHSDHNADYGTLLLLAWSTGLRTRVDAWGPPPLKRITRLFLEMSAPDIEVRRSDQGQPPLGPLIHAHELTAGGPVIEDQGIRVGCARVDHPLVPAAFAYRFDGADRSIVVSGDTRRSESLITLARGADVLVHEALYPDAVNAIAGTGPGSAQLRKHLVDSHTSVEEAGKIAAEAGVKTLVLSHFVPAETPAVPDEAWLDGAKRHFSGRVILGRDLLEID
jgi:ribonuclease BN (tRNA processing enzyme)